MNVISYPALILTIFLAALQVNAAPIDACLADARKMTRAVDQKQAAEGCFQINAKNTTKATCYDLVSKHSLLKKNPELQENLNSICFYQSLEFNNLNSCMAGAARFKLADNHDEALFECYIQFQAQASQKQCIEIGRKLILPHRKNHMLRHCQNNY